MLEKIDDEEVKNLREIFSLEKQEDSKEVKIIRDQEQFALKIPRDFAREMSIDPNIDVFRFVLSVDEENGKKTLSAVLIQNEKEEESN